MLVTLFVSMLPILELRGAIPLAVSLGLDIWPATLISFVGNILPVPFIILFIRRILDWLCEKSDWLKKLIDNKIRKTLKHSNKLYRSEVLGLIILVAIPLPGTGAWTGALLAALLNIRLKVAFPAIAAGVLIAAVLVSGITYGFQALIS
ncbi:MAG TPA: small multi-drug export protein [Clostridiales bacterium]|nr:small multi-drug export protein [Clostridiales bacterium]